MAGEVTKKDIDALNKRIDDLYSMLKNHGKNLVLMKDRMEDIASTVNAHAKILDELRAGK